jgi:hypothetical protein
MEHPVCSCERRATSFIIARIGAEIQRQVVTAAQTAGMSIDPRTRAPIQYRRIGKRVATMQMAVSKDQKLCVFVLAALGGSIPAGTFSWSVLRGISSGTLPPDIGWMAYLGPGLFMLGVVTLQMVVGAWAGALASALWRSPAGKRMFCSLCAGVLGGLLSLILLMPISAGTPLVPTFAGLLFGNLFGRCVERRAERVLQLPTEGLD